MRRPHRRLVPVVALALAFTAGASGAGSSGPTITGTAQPGRTLTADISGWSGGPATFTYQWKRCNSSGKACGDIAHATAEL